MVFLFLKSQISLWVFSQFQYLLFILKTHEKYSHCYQMGVYTNVKKSRALYKVHNQMYLN